MDFKTFLLFLAMYIYGFSLMIWAIFIDKHPTRLSRNAAIAGFAILIMTLVYYLIMWSLGQFTFTFL
jgi:hypothetical protein